jgi:hypothetical protein
LTFEDLVQFGDCFYLPHEDGPEARELFEGIRSLLAAAPDQWGDRAARFRRVAAPLREFCGRVAELRDRALFAALHRRVWELREELDLLERFVEFKTQPGQTDAPFQSDFHQPGTYRGGFVARLQELLTPQPDGTFVPAGQRHAQPE